MSMDSIIQKYAQELRTQFESGHAKEHACRPVHKWLKDRKGRRLTTEYIIHYQKIIKILAETDRTMEEIGQA